MPGVVPKKIIRFHCIFIKYKNSTKAEGMCEEIEEKQRREEEKKRIHVEKDVIEF